jgi:2-polyprenyl-6-methoxyphenol hydroxylase-like FAD-dependent oxidoreductase
MKADAQKLLKENGRVVGVEAETTEGKKNIYASLVIAADGRHSVLREEAGLNIINYGVPIDVLWFKLSRQASDSKSAFGFFNEGKLVVLLNRNEYWQCGYIIVKGGFDMIRQKELGLFRREVATAIPFLKDRVEELADWEQIKLLNVAVDRLEKWYCDGLVCIGDAAHAMSPVGGVGINLALQDAVAAANILYPVLKEKQQPGIDVLEEIQKRREPPTKATQRLQLTIQNNFLNRRLNGAKNMPPPIMLRLFNRFKILRRIPARLIGMGMRVEHIYTPEVV